MGLSTQEWETAPDGTVSCRCLRSPRSRLQKRQPRPSPPVWVRQGTPPHSITTHRPRSGCCTQTQAMEFNPDMAALLRDSRP